MDQSGTCFAKGIVGRLEGTAPVASMGSTRTSARPSMEGAPRYSISMSKPASWCLQVRRHKSRVGAVPHIEHPLMQGHRGSKDAGHHRLERWNALCGGAKRRRACGFSHGPTVGQGAAKFSPHPLHVPTEGCTVFVAGGVAQVEQKLAGHAGHAVQDAGLCCHGPKVTFTQDVPRRHENKSPCTCACKSFGAWTSSPARSFTSRANWRQVSGVWMLSG